MQSLASLSRFTQNPYLQKREVHPRGGPLVKKEQRLRPPSLKTQGTRMPTPRVCECGRRPDAIRIYGYFGFKKNLRGTDPSVADARR